MEESEDPETKLLLQPWASVCFADSNTLMAKAWFGDAGYALLLSDLNNMWYERADIDMIQQRSKELNKRLTAQASSFLNCLRNLVCPLLEGQKNTTTSFSCQPNPDTLILHVKSELSGLPFYWDFVCSAAPVEMGIANWIRIAKTTTHSEELYGTELFHYAGFYCTLGTDQPHMLLAEASVAINEDKYIHLYFSKWEFFLAIFEGRLPHMSHHLVRPLMSMSLVLQCQVQELAALLLQKNAEIEDYQENGATLSRERLKTEPFKEESFLQTFHPQVDVFVGRGAFFNWMGFGIIMTLPHACCLGDGHLFTSSLKELYVAVTQEQARANWKRHREASGDSVTYEHPSSQHLPQKVMDLTKGGDMTESQLTSTESVQDTVAPPSQTEKAQLLLAKTKKKKAKGLFG